MSHDDDRDLADRIRGCLIGGAVGDALGAPVEFASLEQILGAYGSHGVRDYPKATRDGKFRVAPVTDDTQMNLFTVEGLIRMFTRMRLKGIGRSTPASAPMAPPRGDHARLA